MASTKAFLIAQVCALRSGGPYRRSKSQAKCARASVLILTACLLAGCGGGSSQALYPATPKWSLTDKQPLGVTPGQPGPPPGPQPYEYRGGRDPVTGQARNTQGPAVTHQAAPAREAVPSASREASLGQSPRTVEIRKGDTLHGLSLQHHVSVKALMEANNLTTTTIVPGKKLIIPEM